MPLDNTILPRRFKSDWLRQFNKNDEERHEEFVRGFLEECYSQG
jgi:hypothetical protein